MLTVRRSLVSFLLLIALTSLAALWFVVLPGLLGPYWRLPPAPDAQIFRGSSILTMDPYNTVAEAVGTRGDRIVAVGSYEEVRRAMPAGTPVEELGGGALLPGFIEAHGHFPGAGLDAVAADLNAPPIGDVGTIAELIERMKAMEATTGNASSRSWLLGFGYDDTLLAERRHPTRAELDRVSTERPIFVMHVSAHMGVVNSAALKELGIGPDTLPPAGGEIVRDPASGRATGLLRENAVYQARSRALDFGWRQQLAILRRATDKYVRAGVTTAQNGLASEAHLRGTASAIRLGMLPLRVVAWPDWETHEAIRTGRLSIASAPLLIIGATKLIADGSIQGYTGYLTEPYFVQPRATLGSQASHAQGSPWRGYPTLDAQTLSARLAQLYRQGEQVAVHANGDAAIDMVLDAVEAAARTAPRKDPRTILIHAQMIRPDQIRRAQRLGITPSFFVAHTWYWGDRHYEIFLGPERAEHISPLASADAAGLRYTIHQDTPVVPIDPLLSVWTAVARQTTSGRILGERERVDVTRALRATTIDAAWQMRLEDRLGSVEPGKLADFVLLDRDPRADPERLRDLRVLATWVGGRKIYDARSAN